MLCTVSKIRFHTKYPLTYIFWVSRRLNSFYGMECFYWKDAYVSEVYCLSRQCHCDVLIYDEFLWYFNEGECNVQNGLYILLLIKSNCTYYELVKHLKYPRKLIF